jgi:uncharacterized membrane protein YeaQ/YmgE (transglycosylase-associated protein family)
MVGEIFSAIVVGFLAGLLGRAFLPGKQKMGFFATILLGVAGAFVGYLVFAELLGIGDDDEFDLGGLPGAVLGAMLILFLYDRFVAEGSEPTQTTAERAERGRDREARREERADRSDR